LDIEWYSDCGCDADETALELCDNYVRETLELLGIDNYDYVILQGCRAIDDITTKHSYHMIAHNIIFDDFATTQRLFMTVLQSKIEKDSGMMWSYQVNGKTTTKCLIDFSIYTKHRAMRLPFAKKIGSPSDQILNCISGNGYTLEHSVIQPPNTSPMIMFSQMRSIANSVGIHKLPVSISDMREHSQYYIADNRLILAVQSLRILKGLQGTLSHVSGSIIIGRTPPDGRVCSFGVQHKTNNFFCLVNHTLDVFELCNGCGNVCSGQRHIVGNLMEVDREMGKIFDVSARVKPTGYFEIDHTLFTNIQEYSSDSIERFDLESDPIRVHYINSGMCTRKSRMTEKILRQYVRTNPDVRILIIGCRRAFDTTQLSVYRSVGDFKLYSKCNVESQQPQFLVCQWESLHRIRRTYDIILIDESDSVLTCATSLHTNRSRIQDNANMFSTIIKSSQHVICLDANLSSKTVRAINTLVPDRQSEFHYNYKIAMKRTLAFHEDMTSWVSMIKACILDGENVAIVSGSKNVLTGPIQHLCDDLDVPCKLYTSSTPTSELERDFDDSNLQTTLQTYRLVGITPTITVGASYNGSHFDRVFCYGTANSVIPRTLMQMIGRFRFPKIETVEIVIGAKTIGVLPNTPDMILSDFADKVSRREHVYGPCNRQSCRVGIAVGPDGTITFELMPDWLSTVAVHNTLEENLAATNYISEIVRVLSEHGWTYRKTSFDNPDENVESTIASGIEDIRNQKKEAMLAAVQLSDEEFKASQTKLQQGEATEQERMNVLFTVWAKHFNTPITPAHFEEHFPHSKKIRNIAAVKRLSLAGLIETKKDDPFYHIYPELKQDISVQFKLMQDLATSIGLSSSIDRSTTITNDQLIRAIPRIEALRKPLSSEMTYRSRTRCTDIKSTARFLRSMFNQWCGATFSSLGKKGSTFQLINPPSYGDKLFQAADDSNFFI
jgi:hypothetical protein